MKTARRGLLFVLPVISGCGTVISQVAYFSEEPLDMPVPPNVVYGGTTMDAMMIGLCFYAPFSGDVPPGKSLLVVPPCVVFCLVDLGLSLAADTVILPMTVGQEIERAFRSEADEELESEP